MNRRALYWLAMSCALLLGTAHAATQPLDKIQAAAEEFVRARLPAGKAKHYVTAGRLDERLRLQDCPQQLEAFAQATAPSGERVVVGVRCAGASAWTLYVPVTIEVELPVLVLRRALARRAHVTLVDVEPQTRRLPGSAASFVEDIASVQGQRLRRSLPAGTALTVDMLAPDVLVKRGQQVTLVAASGPVEIRAQGHALSEGGLAERVRVQNVTSLKIVEGVVESDSTVRVGL